MKYRQADLDYIFVRAKHPNGNWGNLSLNELTDKQFIDWATQRFGIEIKDDINAQNTPWTSQQKVDFLNEMNKRMGGKPCVCMIKREVRNEWDKKN
jgi:hypothetical protein